MLVPCWMLLNMIGRRLDFVNPQRVILKRKPIKAAVVKEVEDLSVRVLLIRGLYKVNCEMVKADESPMHLSLCLRAQ